MEALVVLLILFLVLVLIILPIWTLVSVTEAKHANRRLAERLAEMERRLNALSYEQLNARKDGPAPVVPPVAAPETEAVPAPADPADAGIGRPLEPSREEWVEEVAPFRLGASEPEAGAEEKSPSPPPLPAAPKQPLINWELFMGVKLFAWIGGFALFLAVAFFVKYSFEHDLIPAEVRVAIGYLVSLGLVVGGMRMGRSRYTVTAQTLCASGVVSLYAVTFACHAVYKFPFFGALPTFALMALITGAAFLLAVRMEAKVVAVLGMLGGFFTPVLLSTGQDNPAGLFGYLALLDAGLIAVALHRRWHFLVPLGGGGTLLMLLGWTDRFFVADKVFIAMGVCLGFGALFTGALAFARRREQGAAPVAYTAVAAPLVSLGYAFYFLGFPALAERPGLLFLFVLFAELLLLAVMLIEEALVKAQIVAGGLVFGFLACWTTGHLTEPLLPWALGGFLGFAGLHTVLPLVLRRRWPEFASPWWAQLAAPLTLLLVLGAVCKFETVSWLVWPCVLLLDVIAIGLAFFTASIGAVAAVLVLTLVAMGAWIFRVPAEITTPFALLGVLAGFALLFFGAGLFLVRRFGPKMAGGGAGLPGDPRAHLPALSALLPFALLIMVILRLPLASPSAVFGLALLLVALTLGLARILVLEWLPAAALAGVVAVQGAWLAARFHADGGAGVTIAWNLGFYAVFALFPFVFRKTFADMRGPWVAAAAGAAAHFWLVYRAVQEAFPNHAMGLLPAAFAVPALASLVVVLRSLPADHPQRLGRLAWFGGVALLFITLIFPIQFSRQWLTLGWALEGAALLWLFQRVPHAGLRAVGVALLAAVFARLALNPAVLGYHPRAAMPIFNWYLYTYGLAIACFLAGARLLETPREKIFGCDAPPWLRGAAAVLAFLLLNIEVADYFSTSGSALMFEFSGNLARDMTYTIAWALFAFGLLVIGIWKHTPMARYAALALLGVTLLKLFFHDLAHLGQLYRIAALAVVAVIAILASFVYQRFLSTHEKTPPSAP